MILSLKAQRHLPSCLNKPHRLTLTIATTVLAGCISSGALADPQIESEEASQSESFFRGGVIGLALTFGGDEISRETVDTAFSGTDTETIDAGELAYFYGGVRFGNEKYELQTTIGYHVDQINGSNGDTGFCRYPLEAIAFANFEKFRAGVGVSYHLNPEYERDVDGSPKLNADFDDATGVVFQIDYIFNGLANSEGVTVGIRYTDIEYEVTSSNFAATPGQKFDGSNIGISASWLF